MKKTKLLTSLVALALVLGLGACGETEEDTTTGDEDGTTSQTTEGSGSDSEPIAYALVGAFDDADWDAKPAEDSKYYIPLETEEYKVTVTMGEEPDYGEWDPWNAGLRVVEWGESWTLVAGYDELAEGSTGVLGEGSDYNIAVSWGATYDLTITLGETNSILVELVEEDNGHVVDDDPVETPAALINKAIDKASYSLDIIVYEYDTEVFTSSDFNEGNVNQDDLVSRASLVDTTRLLVYCTSDAIQMDKYILSDGAWVPSESEIDANYENSSYVFKNTNEGNFDEYTYIGKLTSMGYSCSDWADAYYSLFDLSGKDALTDGDFSYIDEVDNGGLSYDASEVAADLALCTGFDYWYDSADKYAEEATLDYLYFYPTLQEIKTYYTCGRWADAYVDNTGASSDRYYFGYDFAIDIFNVGTTDLTAVAESLIELIPAE